MYFARVTKKTITEVPGGQQVRLNLLPVAIPRGVHVRPRIVMVVDSDGNSNWYTRMACDVSEIILVIPRDDFFVKPPPVDEWASFVEGLKYKAPEAVLESKGDISPVGSLLLSDGVLPDLHITEGQAPSGVRDLPDVYAAGEMAEGSDDVRSGTED